MKAQAAKLEILNPVGEVLTTMGGEKADGEIRFVLDGKTAGVSYRLVVE